MPTWREVAEWLNGNVHKSSSWDPRDSDPYDMGRDACVEALFDKAAFEERAAELRAIGTKLYRVTTRVNHWPGRAGPVALVQFIRDDAIVLAELFDSALSSDTKARMRTVEAMSRFDSKSSTLEDRRHYVDVAGDINLSEGLRFA